MTAINTAGTATAQLAAEHAQRALVRKLGGEIVDALLIDQQNGGYDLESGMFGPAFSDLVRRWAKAESSMPATAFDENECRDAFEASRHRGDWEKAAWYVAQRDHDGGYKGGGTNTAWREWREGWLASRAALLPPWERPVALPPMGDEYFDQGRRGRLNGPRRAFWMLTPEQKREQS